MELPSTLSPASAGFGDPNATTQDRIQMLLSSTHLARTQIVNGERKNGFSGELKHFKLRRRKRFSISTQCGYEQMRKMLTDSLVAARK